MRMKDRRRFLQVVGGSALAMSTGCAANVSSNGAGSGGSGAGGSGAGGSGAGGSGAGGSGGSGTTTSGAACTANPPGTKLGKPGDYATTGLHIVTDLGILVGRDAGGLYALTAVCTHQGCDMSQVDASGPYGEILSGGKDIRCLCHGSEFGATGSVVIGPAHIALKAYALALGCDGYLYANKSKVVAATVRLMA
jgi:Rieske Fe-S protein